MKRLFLKSAVIALAATMTAAAAQAQDWSGPYADVFVGFGVTGIETGVAGVQLGYNAALGGDWYAGGEFDATAHIGSSSYQYYEGRLRGGYDIGPALVYGTVGYGQSGNQVEFWSAGAGAQVPLGTNTYVRGDLDFLTPTGGGTTRGFAKLGVGMSF